MEAPEPENPIRRLRLAKSLTQLQVAEAIGVTVVTLSGWERDVSLPDARNLLRLAEFFKVHPRQLVAPEAA